MYDVLQLLDAALRLSEREMNALRNNELDETERLAFERSVLIREAVNAPVPANTAVYRDKLTALRDAQISLIREAGLRKERISAGLRNSRMQRQRMGGYRVSVSQALA